MSRLCIYFCNTLPRDFAPRYLPPLRTISTRVISFQRRMGIRTMHTGVHCPTEPTVCFSSCSASPIVQTFSPPPRECEICIEYQKVLARCQPNFPLLFLLPLAKEASGDFFLYPLFNYFFERWRRNDDLSFRSSKRTIRARSSAIIYIYIIWRMIKWPSLINRF